MRTLAHLELQHFGGSAPIYLPRDSVVLKIPLDADDSVTGLDALDNVFGSIYTGTCIAELLDDLNGLSIPLMLNKWAELGSRDEIAGHIVDLVWTDYMANLVVGTRSSLNRVNGASMGMRSAQRYETGLAYDWRFTVTTLVFTAAYITLLAHSR